MLRLLTCRKRDLCRCSFYKSLNLLKVPHNTIQRHSQVKSSTYVSQQTKEKHKPIHDNNYAAKLPKKKKKQSKSKRAQNVIQQDYLCGSSGVRLLREIRRCHYNYYLLIIRATRRRLTYGDRVYSASFFFYLSNEILRMRALACLVSVSRRVPPVQLRKSIELWGLGRTIPGLRTHTHTQFFVCK